MQLAERQQQQESDNHRWVTFRLDEEIYAVEVMQVREVLRSIDITPVPGSQDYVLGIINLRGNVVTVIDTRVRFGLKSKPTDDLSRIVVVEIGDEAAGFMVDAISEVRDIDSTTVALAPGIGKDESSRHVIGVASDGDEMVILVDFSQVFINNQIDLPGVVAS